MIPEGWHQQLLGDVCEIKIGGTPARKESEYWAKDKSLGYPWVSIADLKSKWITKTKESISELGVKKSNVKLINAGTTIMSFKLTIGRVARAGIDLYTNEAIAALVPLNGQIDNDFLYYALPIAVGKTETDQAVKGATLNKKKLNDVIFLHPSLPEQKKIAAVLSSVDDAIQATQAVIDQTRRIKQGLLQQLLTRGIGHTRFKQTEIGEIPETWKVATTGQICTSIVPGRDKPKCFNGDIPWLTISDIDGLKVNESKLGLKVTKKELQQVNGKTVPKDAVLMTCVGTFGIVAVAGRELVMNQQLHGFVCGSEVLPLYLCLVLQTKESEMKKISGQTTIPYLNKAKCESIRVPLPPIIEQNQIVYKIVSIEENINANKKYLDGLSSLKRGLMQDLLTGRMRVGGST